MSRPFLQRPTTFATNVHLLASDLCKLYGVGCNTMTRWRAEHYATVPDVKPTRGHNVPHTAEAKAKMSVSIRATIAAKKHKNRVADLNNSGEFARY
jgi:hypothetical protein